MLTLPPWVKPGPAGSQILLLRQDPRVPRGSFIFLALLAACGGTPTPPGPPPPPHDDEWIELPAFDRAAVEAAYPILAGKILSGAEAHEHYPDVGKPTPVPAQHRWVATVDLKLTAGAQVRITADGRPFEVTVPNLPIEVDVADGVTVVLKDRTIVEVRDELTAAFEPILRHPNVRVEVMEDTLKRYRPRRYGVIGWVGTVGEKSSEIPPNVGIAVGNALDGALVNQILVVRCRGEQLERVIVADLLKHEANPRPLNPHVADGDVIVVPRIYPLRFDHAPEWEDIAAFAAGQIDRRGLLDRVAARNNRPR